MPERDAPTGAAADASDRTILIADDMNIVREPIAASLRAAGYEVICACDGKEALELIRSSRPRLALLDLNMPVLDGLAVVRAMHALPSAYHAHVILLTADTDRDRMIDASRLGVKDYLLKRCFHFSALLERVKKYVPLPTPSAAPAAQPTPPAAPAPEGPAKSGANKGVKLMSPQECVARAQTALEGRTLSGVIMHVISLIASPRADLSEIASFVACDSVLSARILQVANSAAYASSGGPVTSIADAVRNIGCSTVSQIATAVGIFDAIPAGNADAFDPIRCWQHSLAVAQLCERLTAGIDPASAGVAHLVGLCHDLAGIFFHSHFSAEYARVLEVHRTSQTPLDQLEREYMGLTRETLLKMILGQIGLPDCVRAPIEAFHEAERDGKVPTDRLSRILRLADRYACGLFLAPDTRSSVYPLSRSECRAATGTENPARPDSVQFRSEILALTGTLARLGPKEEAALLLPQTNAVDGRIWLARDASFSTFDPVTAALESMVRVDVRDRLPLAQQEWTDHRGLVTISKTSTNSALSPAQLPKSITAAMNGNVPFLWTVARTEGEAREDAGAKPTLLPLALTELTEFVKSLPSRQSPLRKASA
jgi:two-component system chemotaxis response regulator CheY